MIQKTYQHVESGMKKTVESIVHELSMIRTGRASLAILDNVTVECYGSKMPLNQVATLAVPESRMITIQPWDKSSFDPILRGLQSANLGLNPMSDGKLIRLPIPQPTEERRLELLKVVKKKVEDGRVGIRNVRRDGNDKIKSLLKEKEITEDEEKNALDHIQKITDEFISRLNNIAENKEKEIQTL